MLYFSFSCLEDRGAPSKCHPCSVPGTFPVVPGARLWNDQQSSGTVPRPGTRNNAGHRILQPDRPDPVRGSGQPARCRHVSISRVHFDSGSRCSILMYVWAVGACFCDSKTHVLRLRRFQPEKGGLPNTTMLFQSILGNSPKGGPGNLYPHRLSHVVTIDFWKQTGMPSEFLLPASGKRFQSCWKHGMRTRYFCNGFWSGQTCFSNFQSSRRQIHLQRSKRIPPVATSQQAMLPVWPSW